MPEPPQQPKWYYNVWFVLLMLFVVLGPFGLPLVWKHPRFSRKVKMGLTVLTLGYTIWLSIMTVRAVRMVIGSSTDSLRAIESLRTW
jgi:hypothetical protein